MRDIAINMFDDEIGNFIDLSKSVTGYDLTGQKCLVNIATELGSDLMYNDRGTDLLNQGISGLLLNINQARHYGNFAAANTLYFIREQDRDKTLGTRAKLLDAGVRSLDNDRVKYNLNITFEDGAVRSFDVL